MGGASRGQATGAVRLHILHVRVTKGLSSFFRSTGGVYLVTSVVDGLGENAISFQGMIYPSVKDGDFLPLGTQGDSQARFTIYLREGRLPRVLCFSLLVLKSNESMRAIGQAINDAVADKEYAELSKSISALLMVANPPYQIVFAAAQQAINILGKHLGAKPDDQLCYYQANYTRRFDRLGKGRHPEFGSRSCGKVELAYEINLEDQ